MKNLVKILKSLAEPNRLRIVMAIGKHSRSVSEIIKATGMTQPLVSFHLKALRSAELVETKRKGPFVFYNLSSERLLELLDELSQTNALST